jgi:nucleoside-diphosphate-sugar epimerase
MDLKNQKILVTGADGFIGSHLVEGLLDKGCQVRAFVFYNSFNSLGWLDTFPKDKLDKLDVFSGDIRDPNGVRKAMQGMDMVFHLAAQPIKTGELFSADNITAKRPGGGISPMRWDEVLGQTAQKDYEKDDLI